LETGVKGVLGSGEFMSFIDGTVILVALIGLGIWIRGARRNSLGDLGLGLSLGAVACSTYFFLFSLTRTEWLATIILCVFLTSLLAFRGFRRGTAGRAFLIAVVVLIAASAIIEHRMVSAGNALLVIEPYRSTAGGWAFDEPRLGLKREPFVLGIPEMIDKMVAGIPGSQKSVRLIFSQQPFPGSSSRLDRIREENGGNWYRSEEYRMEGWLCPALFKFFPRAPRHIYVKAESMDPPPRSPGGTRPTG
jgi:uncharacterized protein DUF6717